MLKKEKRKNKIRKGVKGKLKEGAISEEKKD